MPFDGGEAGPQDHGTSHVPASLLDDDHPQYALLAGRGGQILIGGVVAGNALSLQSAEEIRFATQNPTPVQRAIITNLGLFGVNTPTPLELIYVVGGAIGGAENEAQAGRWNITTGSGIVAFGTLFPTSLALKTGNINRLFISTAGAVGIGVLPTDASVLLQLESTAQGFLMPRLTTVQKLAIGSPATGLEVFDTNLNRAEFFDGAAWVGTGLPNVTPVGSVWFSDALGEPISDAGIFWDNTNKRLVIGSAAPSTAEKLLVAADAGNANSFRTEQTPAIGSSQWQSDNLSAPSTANSHTILSRGNVTVGGLVDQATIRYSWSDISEITNKSRITFATRFNNILSSQLILGGGDTDGIISINAGGGAHLLVSNFSGPVLAIVQSIDSDATLKLSAFGSSGDAILSYSTDNAVRWVVGVDQSVADEIVWAFGSALTTNPRMRLTTAGDLKVGPVGAPASRLMVAGDGTAAGVTLTLEDSFGEAPKKIDFKQGALLTGQIEVFGRPSSAAAAMHLRVTDGASVTERISIEKLGTIRLKDVDGVEEVRVDSGGLSISQDTAALSQPVYGSDDDLALYIPFAETLTGVGTEFDRSPFGNDGTLASAGNVGSFGKFGKAWRGTGVANEHLAIPTDPSLEFTAAITVECWIKPNQVSVFKTAVSKMRSDLSGWGLHTFGGFTRITFRDSGGLQFDGGGSPITVGVWQHVAFTWDGADVRTYTNGVLAQTTAESIGWDDSTDDLLVGARKEPGFGAFFDGDIDEVRVYSRALATQEIRTQYLRGGHYGSIGALTSNAVRAVNASGTLVFDSASGGKIVHVFSVANLPAAITAPDGISRRPLGVGTKYIVHNSFFWPRCYLPVIVSSTAFEVIEIVGARFDVNILIDGPSEPGGDADTPHFWGRNASAIAFTGFSFVDLGNSFTGRSTVLLDSVGGIAGISNFAIDFCSMFNFKNLGSMIDHPLFHSSFFQAGNERGIVMRSTLSGTLHLANSVQPVTLGVAAKTPAMSFQGIANSITIGSGSIRQLAADSAYHIDSAYSGTAAITGVSYKGPAAAGNFFRPDISKSITAGDVFTRTFQSVAASATNPSTESQITTLSIQPDIRRGDSVFVEVLTGDTVYQGLRTVLRVSADQKSFDISVVFGATATGTFGGARLTAANHGLIRGETIAISGTPNYNGARKVWKVNDDNSFTIDAQFVAGAVTGTVASTGLDERSVGISSLGNGAQSDSLKLAFGEMNGNGAVTSVASNAYQNIDCTGLTLNPGSQRFVLTNAAIGLFTYVGLPDFFGAFKVNGAAVKATSTQTYRFAVSVNDATPVFATASYFRIEVKTTSVPLSGNLPVSLVTGDTVQIKQAGVGTTSGFTIQDFFPEIT